MDRSDNDRMVWQERDPAGNLELWESPRAPLGTPAKPRRVRAIPQPWASMAVNAGAALMITGKDQAVLVRFSDGAMFDVRASVGDAFAYTVWVSDAEVVLATADASVTEYTSAVNSIVRIERASLPLVP